MVAIAIARLASQINLIAERILLILRSQLRSI